MSGVAACVPLVYHAKGASRSVRRLQLRFQDLALIGLVEGVQVLGHQWPLVTQLKQRVQPRKI